MLKFSLKIRRGKYKISLLSDNIINIASPSLRTDRNDGNCRELRHNETMTEVGVESVIDRGAKKSQTLAGQ